MSTGSSADVGGLPILVLSGGAAKIFTYALVSAVCEILAATGKAIWIGLATDQYVCLLFVMICTSPV